MAVTMAAPFFVLENPPQNVDQGSGQVEDPELVVGGAGWSAVAKAMARQVKKRDDLKDFEPARNAAMGPYSDCQKYVPFTAD
ncbi:MAG: hypothetical protein JRI70_08800 [Deltaproteobacteria bacterium]|nr:hypothetical protein [Deltaproteobacteria bacterium]